MTFGARLFTRKAVCSPLVLAGLAGTLACSSSDNPPGSPSTLEPPGACPQMAAPETCFEAELDFITARFDRPHIVLTPGQTRSVTLYVAPELCTPAKATFDLGDSSVASASADSVELCYARSNREIQVTGNAVGETTLTATVPRVGSTPITVEISVEVVDAALPSCDGSETSPLADGKLSEYMGASVGLQAGATKANFGSFLWGVDPFDVTVKCAADADQIPDGYVALGPAFTFAPEDVKLPREIPFTLPINPGLIPDAARLRHVTVSYTGPSAKTPRVVPIADPKIIKVGSGYRLSFMAPWLGTYQAVAKSDGGQVTHQRRLTYRAMMGISMGGSGTSTTGFQNHDRFDVLAPLGGPVEYTWLLGHIARNHMGGFLPNDGDNVPAELAPMPEPLLPYEHGSTFNQWWYEYPKTGNGGSFPRGEYVQIFRDLALMWGNPAGHNATPGAENLPPGVPLDHPVVVGERDDRSCAVWVDPIDEHPNVAEQDKLDDECPLERCKIENQITLSNFYDANYNPKGTWPVISFCDGSRQDSSLSPYANTWKPEGNDKPFELALAVDYNGNGLRDLNEPLIYQGHELFEDVGADGLASAQEPGYAAGVNDDPSGDDWHPQYNPTGTEGNYRYDASEPYSDFGLDGVEGTVDSPYDHGEGNGEFDYAPGYRTFLERDSRSVIGQYPLATGPAFDDEAMNRLDLWTDGGTRDLFNSHVAAYSLIGEWAGRDKIVHYYTDFGHLPGQTEGEALSVSKLNWEDIPGGAFLRYGAIDPTDADIEDGNGQHVGTGLQVAQRLQMALFFIGSRWKNAPRNLHKVTQEDPDENLEYCEVSGACRFEFTDSRGRTGPVSVTLPPGYGHKTNVEAGTRYPIVFLLHGYGQGPDDLAAAAAFLSNWMNFHQDSAALRLPKTIVVYLDGRCRPNGPGEETECIRGNFYTDSVREKGPKMTKWALELMDELDKRYRTMQPEVVEWTE